MRSTGKLRQRDRGLLMRRKKLKQNKCAEKDVTLYVNKSAFKICKKLFFQGLFKLTLVRPLNSTLQTLKFMMFLNLIWSPSLSVFTWSEE